MGYTPEMFNAAVAALTAEVHGLHPDVARAWATAEQGVNFNILGVTYRDEKGQHLYRYGSWREGAAAAARLIANGPYAGIRKALAGGSSRDQARAIIASPWNHPYYSRGRGAAALRAIADGPNPADPAVYRVIVDGTMAGRPAMHVPVYSSPGGNRIGAISSGTYTAHRIRSGGRWWYYVIGPHHSGILDRWLPAEPTPPMIVQDSEGRQIR